MIYPTEEQKYFLIENAKNMDEVYYDTIKLMKQLNTPTKPFFNEWWLYCFISSDGEWLTCTVDRETFINSKINEWHKKGINFGHCIYTQIPWLEYINAGRSPENSLIKLEDFK